MIPGMTRSDTPPGAAHDKTLLNQKRFNNVFQGTALLTDGGGKIIDTRRTAGEFIHQGV